MARLTFKGLDHVAYNKRFLDQQRIKANIEDMTTKFGDQVLGVHGKELPKFAEKKEDNRYWKNYKGYCHKPKT